MSLQPQGAICNAYVSTMRAESFSQSPVAKFFITGTLPFSFSSNILRHQAPAGIQHIRETGGLWLEILPIRENCTVGYTSWSPIRFVLEVDEVLGIRDVLLLL